MKRWYVWIAVAAMTIVSSVLLYNNVTASGPSLCGQQPCPLLPGCCK